MSAAPRTSSLRRSTSETTVEHELDHDSNARIPIDNTDTF